MLLVTVPFDGGARITSLDLSTHFLDPTLLASIGRYGGLGSLKHLTLGTTGTRLTADGLQAALEGCTALESFTLKDGEGKFNLSFPVTTIKLTIRPAGQNRLGSNRFLAFYPSQPDYRDCRKRRTSFLGSTSLDVDPSYSLCPTRHLSGETDHPFKSSTPVSDRHYRRSRRSERTRARSDPSNATRGDHGWRGRCHDAGSVPRLVGDWAERA
jgi:hypothetical protein